jgi:hypothetical protein
MAMPRTWLPRSDEIIAVLSKMKSKQLDRAAIEELFQLQRRAAIDLMNHVGRTGDRATGFLVERTSLLSWVKKIAKEESWQLARRQEASEELSRSMAEVQAIRQAMAQEGRQPMTFPMVQEALNANIASLPPNISITQGRIMVEVPEQDAAITACKLLYKLGIAINNDFESFSVRLGDNTSAMKANGSISGIHDFQ